MFVEAVDLTTAPFLFKPEDAFKTAGEINKQESEKPIGVEVYPLLPRVITKLVKPEAVITADRIKGWQDKYEAKAVRVHLPWMYDWKEIGYEVKSGDWYSSPVDRFVQAGLMYVVGPSTNNFGVKLAHELGIGVNIHPNVIEGYAKDGKLDYLKSQVAFVYGENSIEFNALYQKDRKVLGDPRQTVKNDVIGHSLDGFLLAIDHMFGISPTNDRQTISKAIDQITEVINDQGILASTKAAHLALPGHGLVEVGDKDMEQVLIALAQAQFINPVRLALDIHPKKISTMTPNEQLNYVRSFRNWVLNTIDKYN